MPSPSPLLSSSREDVERLCIENLLTAAEERVFFKDLEGRYIMVSAGWLAAEGGGRSLGDVIGKTDFDLFGAAYAQTSREDEQHVIASGSAVVAKVARQTYDGRQPAWVSTTRVPLRSRDGERDRDLRHHARRHRRRRRSTTRWPTVRCTTPSPAWSTASR